MNSLDRVIATIKGEKKDRIPISLTLSLYGAKLIKCPLNEYYSDPIKYVEGQLNVRDVISPDIIFSPFSLPIFGKAFGSEIKIFKNQPPNLIKPYIKNPEELERLDFQRAIESKELQYISDTVAGLSKYLSKEVPIAAILPSPYDLPVMLMGIENWIEVLLSYPKEAEILIEKTSDFFKNYSNQLVELGASVIVLPAAFINPTIITTGIAVNIQKKLIPIFMQIKCSLVLHSGGAKMIPFLKIYQAIDNVIAFVVNSDDDLTLVRQNLLNNQTIIGNLEGPSINNQTVKEVRSKTMDICKKMCNDSNFIFGSSGADIPIDTPLENILIIKESIEEYYG